MTELGQEFDIVHMLLRYEKRYISGTNKDAAALFMELCMRGVYIHGFVDTQNAGIHFFHKPVYEMDKVDLEQDNTILLTKEICDEYGLLLESKEILIDQKSGKRITPGAIAQMGEYFEYEHIKEIILYGNNLSLAEKYAEVFKCLDFPQVSFMYDQDSSEGKGENIKPIEEIVYKDDFVVLLYEEDAKELLDKLYYLGVDRRKCGRVSPWSPPNFNTRSPLLDVHLGYTYDMNSEYAGIHIYGENHENDFKIAVLGESTTESGLDSHICPWVEIMYKHYCQSGITIFNGGVGGYYSGQELIKLKRDILKLNPDMIIVYDGHNDLMQAVLQKRFYYLESLVNFAGPNIPAADGSSLQKKKAFTGIPSGQGPVDDWLENIECMYAISQNKNIKFFAFMEPTLFTKKNLDLHSKTIFQTMLFHGDNFKFMKLAEEFRQRAGEIEQSHNYIHDLTYIFDDDDVYMDIVHVYDRGNEIIAEHIWNIIKDSVPRHFD